jgi:hypothetical protein
MEDEKLKAAAPEYPAYVAELEKIIPTIRGKRLMLVSHSVGKSWTRKLWLEALKKKQTS